MPACTKCAENVPADASFCPHCGTKFQSPPSVAPAPPPADPFSHTMPADPDELARLSDMIAEQRSKAPLPPPAPVPVRERQFGKTKALAAADDRRGDAPAGEADRVTRERTMASPIAPAAPLPSPSPSPPVPHVSHVGHAPPPRAPMPTPSTELRVPAISPKAATTAQPAVHVVGAAVKVLWTDGNAYAATIVQVTPTHCSVRFANGALQWVDSKNVFPA